MCDTEIAIKKFFFTFIYAGTVIGMEKLFIHK